MRIGGRSVATIVKAIFKRCHYVAARNMLFVYENPLDGFRRYLLGRGSYPASIAVRTPAGRLILTAYGHDDILTINEIFCRNDYPTSPDDVDIVDFGSNIGISAAFFLSMSQRAHAHLFEPLPSNIARLKLNLAPFEGRYTLYEAAVGLSEGDVEFGFEESGRYGGVGLRTGNYISVPCLDSNAVLEKIVTERGKIDILKIDIETLERQVTERLPAHLAKRIRKIYVEYTFANNPLAATHRMAQYASIGQFTNVCD